MINPLMERHIRDVLEEEVLCFDLDVIFDEKCIHQNNFSQVLYMNHSTFYRFFLTAGHIRSFAVRAFKQPNR